jgi:hypothetical protein
MDESIHRSSQSSLQLRGREGLLAEENEWRCLAMGLMADGNGCCGLHKPRRASTPLRQILESASQRRMCNGTTEAWIRTGCTTTTRSSTTSWFMNQYRRGMARTRQYCSRAQHVPEVNVSRSIGVVTANPHPRHSQSRSVEAWVWDWHLSHSGPAILVVSKGIRRHGSTSDGSHLDCLTHIVGYTDQTRIAYLGLSITRPLSQRAAPMCCGTGYNSKDN